MEILICVKEVPDDTVEIHLDPATSTPNLAKVDVKASAFDAYALEMAVRFIEANGGSVTLLTAGDKDITTTMKNCIAVGGKQAYIVNDPALANADSFESAKIIKAAAEKIEAERGVKFDLIMVGKETTDYISGEFGGILAETMGLPIVTNIVEFSACEAGIQAKKELESGFNVVEAPIPAVVTVATPNYEPRYPTIKSKMAARKAKIPTMTLADLGAEVADSKVKITSYADPVRKDAGAKYMGLDPEAAAAKAMEILVESKML